jgi:hypothetical protein
VPTKPIEPTESRPPNSAFDYFMLRIEREAASADPGPNGTVERLGTGDKHDFAGGPHLLELLTGWRRSNWKMRRPEDPGNGTATPVTGNARIRID